jgi:N6-L-threonylcarbamoyladenine synthase
MKILGLETSCDESGATILEADPQKPQDIKILGESLISQIKIHAKTQGVVPEVAARAHVLGAVTVLRDVLKKSKLDLPSIDLIAVTEGPGLIPALLVGTTLAKALSFSLEKPIVGVHHIAAHIYSSFLNQTISFPHLALVVSGGHTQLVLMLNFEKFEIIGRTRDDAAGEAFDKVAKLLNLGYPGGPIISKLAEKGDFRKIDLPRPMLKSPDFDFSFSGLKTAVRLILEKNPQTKKEDLAASFQQAVIDVLIFKTIKALKTTRARSLSLSGGVSANLSLRTQLQSAIKKEFSEKPFFVSSLKYCTDNATMVALAGFYKANCQKPSSWQNIEANSNKKLI